MNMSEALADPTTPESLEGAGNEDGQTNASAEVFG